MISDKEKELERDFARAFLQTIGIPSQVILQDHEGPDFILHYSELIGIEVTQLFSEPNTGEGKRVRIEGGWDDVLHLALTLWNVTDRPKVDVRIIFNDSNHISKIEKPIIANELIKLVSRYLPAPGESFCSSEVLVVLPSWIVDLNIYRYYEAGTQTWTYTDSDWTPSIPYKLIQKGINRKEELRRKYLKQCDTIWLLLILYGRRPSGRFIVPNDFKEVRFQFEFDRVFLFDAFPPRSWELQRKEITA